MTSPDRAIAESGAEVLDLPSEVAGASRGAQICHIEGAKTLARMRRGINVQGSPNDT